MQLDSSHAQHLKNKTKKINELYLGKCQTVKVRYILRDIAPANNQKLEDHGHTMVYIKEDMIGFYYDHNIGIKDLYLKNHGDELWNLLEDNYNHFHVTHFRFYRLD